MSELTQWEEKAAKQAWWKPVAIVGVALLVVIVFALIPSKPPEVKKPKKAESVDEMLAPEENVDWNNF